MLSGAATGGKKRERMTGSKRRAEILEAAAGLFKERGYSAASIDAIGALAGVSGPAIYRHFSGKPEILIALLEGAVQKAVFDVEHAVANAQSEAKLKAMVDAIIIHAVSERSVIALLQSRVAELAPGDRKRLEAIRSGLVNDLAKVFCLARPGISERMTVIYIQAMLGVIGSRAAQSLQGPAEEALFARIVMNIVTT